MADLMEGEISKGYKRRKYIFFPFNYHPSHEIIIIIIRS